MLDFKSTKSTRVILSGIELVHRNRQASVRVLSVLNLEKQIGAEGALGLIGGWSRSTWPTLWRPALSPTELRASTNLTRCWERAFRE